MRTENIEVTFKIPIPVDKPDLNGVIYSKEAIRNAYKNVKDIPIEIPCSDGQFLPIGVAQEVELIEDEDGMYVTGVGLVWHGGTDESVEVEDGKVTSSEINGSAKLTPEQVLEIYRRSWQGESNIQLANEFSVHPDTIGRIKNQKSWKDILNRSTTKSKIK